MYQTNSTPLGTGKKDDEGKVQLDLIEPDFILNVGEVLTQGAKKYGKNNWQKLEDAEDRYYSAIMRHLMAWRMGEKTDTDSGLNPMYHIAANAMFLAHIDKEKK